jgi:hypothetical protein
VRWIRTHIAEICGMDPVSENILVWIVVELDRATWMLRVQPA